MARKVDPKPSANQDGTAISGNVNTDTFVGRDQINITYQLKIPPFQSPPDLAALRQAYLQHLQNCYRALDFKGIPQLDNFSHELLLEEVYVPLLAQPEAPSGETLERRLAGRGAAASLEDELGELRALPSEAPALPVEEAVGKFPRVVVLGDPGSGKSTLLKYLALSLAQNPEAPLPILAPLNAFAAALLKDPDLSLQAFLPVYFAGLSAELGSLAPLLDLAIAQGQALVLLDGLDEVQQGRAHLATKVERFAADVVSHGGKLIVSSRIVGYREAPLNAHDWRLYTLLDFDRSNIETFAEKWCLAFERGTLGDTPEAKASAERERQGLLDALDANPGVARLAANPLLLTILALIKRQGVNLPNRRVELYELYLKTLITSWSRARALDKRPVGPELDYLQTIAVLSPLALWLREENPTAGLVTQERLIEWLAAYYQSDEWGLKRGEALKQATEFLTSVRRYSNLLLERGQGRYGFIHLTFEEALAARGIVQRDQLDLQDSLALIQAHLTDPAWRETILLAVGVWGLVRERPRVAGEVVRAMLNMPCPGGSACTNVLLAGACLEDVGELGLGRAVAREVQEALLSACRNRTLPPETQRDAGFSLGRTGWTPPDLEDWVTIPAGTYRVGDDRHPVQIEQTYRLSKYPVTNRQYAAFVQAGGYADRQWWSEVGWSWRTGEYDTKEKDEIIRRWLERRPAEKRHEPLYWHQSRWNNPLAPVVGVSWFEAEAYCTWLSARLGKPVRLPTETEWEAAARGPEGWEYPWGNDWDPTRLNTSEYWAGEDDLTDYSRWEKWRKEKSESASTTIVGQFPAGATPAGLCDLAGNVWEWCNSWYDTDQIRRVGRGGAWNGYRRYARCASRDGLVPASFSCDLGFRLFSPG
ncbi:MAG TPA: SUMF1/EgtB/PvdO family nonheme iron enzyme [Anaerolineaceae bacterium]|nr:SUMF1/EgtB/PvdO family nonheme iron enzyme [Anaerolineaceae bacterium]HQH86114.1 SUMF1/EgtB/PvdO family nonheme iron enzyme [Anaerolineaceae bacterium]